jgi:hypothetical protein
MHGTAASHEPAEAESEVLAAGGTALVGVRDEKPARALEVGLAVDVEEERLRFVDREHEDMPAALGALLQGEVDREQERQAAQPRRCVAQLFLGVLASLAQPGLRDDHIGRDSFRIAHFDALDEQLRRGVLRAEGRREEECGEEREDECSDHDLMASRPLPQGERGAIGEAGDDFR